MGPESRRGKICGIVWTGEKVLDGFRNIRAVRAVWGRGSIDGMEVTLEFGTVTRAKLGEGGPVMPGKGQLRGINFRRDMSKNRIRGRRLDSFLDSRGVELGDGFLIIRRGKNTICKERLYFREKFGLEGELFVTRTKRDGNICMGGVGRAKG